MHIYLVYIYDMSSDRALATGCGWNAGNGAAGDGRVPALVDARGAGAARRAASCAAVCPLIVVIDWGNNRGGEARATMCARRHGSLSLSLTLGAAAGRPARRSGARIWSPSPESRTARRAARVLWRCFLVTPPDPEARSRRWQIKSSDRF
jgi:hypothetical protein